MAKKVLSSRTAVSMCTRTLKACTSAYGFIAGSHHFVDLWARDSLFATFGANIVGLHDVSKRTIETFLTHQRADGLIPYLIMRSHHNVGKYFGNHRYYETPKPHFRSHQSFGTVPDGGLMTIIAARNYAEGYDNRAFLEKHYIKLHTSMEWYRNKFGDRLISEWFLCEWADAVLKCGKTLYTNVLYYKAAGDLSWIAERLNKRADAERYAKRQLLISEHIRSTFWNGSYFADWVDWKRQDYLASHANMLAIIFGLATPKEARSIIDAAKSRSWDGRTLKNVSPAYPWWRIPFLQTVIGVPDYHNGMIWLQPGILFAMALHKTGFVKEAKRVLGGIAKTISTHNGVFEVYEKNAKPVRRRLYQAEHPFAWSAGLFLWAAKHIGVADS